MFHCVKSYNPSKKTKLGTWIGNYARYLCLNSINTRKFIVPTTDNDIQKHIEDSQATDDYLKSKTYSQEDYLYVMNLLQQLKDKRIIDIFKLRYFGRRRMIWTQIAKKINVSTQTAINLHNKGLNMLRMKMSSKTISDII